MTSTAAQKHDEMAAAANAALVRTRGGETDVWTGAMAEQFRANPRGAAEPLVRAVMAYVQPDDVVLDVGGGAGRFALPAALRCREVICIDPSTGMRALFDAVAKEERIENARYVQKDWLAAGDIEGDLSIVVNVTYFVTDIVAFVRKLHRASRRRVAISVWAVPPPNLGVDIYRAVFNEEPALVPGHRELLPVLWELDITPEVYVLPAGDNPAFRTYSSRDEAIEAARGQRVDFRIGASDREQIGQRVRSSFDALFEKTAEGFRRRYQPDLRRLLITWETGGS